MPHVQSVPSFGSHASSSRQGASFGKSKSFAADADSLDDTRAQDRFSSARSISSQNFFNNDNDEAQSHRARIDQFSGSRSISSSQFFGREEQDPNHEMSAGEMASYFADTAKTKLAVISQATKEYGSRVSETLSTYWDRLKEKMDSY